MELPAISAAELRERSRAILLGMACGEAVAGESTLTRLALDLGESVATEERVDPESVLRRWSDRGTDPGPRPGSVTGQALRLYGQGFPAAGLAEATARLVPDRSGDGALVRALPLAVAARRDGARLKLWADQSAAITHSDLTSRMATVGGCLLARDLLTRSLEESLARVAQAIREEAPLRLARAFRRPDMGEGPEPGDDAVAVLSQAIHASAGTADLDGVLAELENQAGSGPGVMALAGGLAGAATGIDPDSARVSGLDPALRRRLEALADRLVTFESEEHGPASGVAGSSAFALRTD